MWPKLQSATDTNDSRFFGRTGERGELFTYQIKPSGAVTRSGATLNVTLDDGRNFEVEIPFAKNVVDESVLSKVKILREQQVFASAAAEFPSFTLKNKRFYELAQMDFKDETLFEDIYIPAFITVQNPPPRNNFVISGLTFKKKGDNAYLVGEFKSSVSKKQMFGNKNYSIEYEVASQIPGGDLNLKNPKIDS